MSLMLNEIHEQPAALERLLKSETKKIKSIAEKIRKKKPAFFMLVARGSSDNAALYGKYLIESITGLPAVLAAPSVVTVYKKQPALEPGVVIGISQSGEAPDILEVVEAAKRSGAYTIGITNTAGSPLSEAAHDVILLKAGKEKGLAATKTYTAQILALMSLTAAVAEDSNLNYHIEKAPRTIEKMLALEKPIFELCERYRYMQHCVIVGRGYNYSTAREAALKLMETCYIVAQPFSTADFMHGPIAITGAGFPAFVVVPEGLTAPQLHALCAELKEKKLETIIVSPLKKTLKLATRGIEIPSGVPEEISPLTHIVPFQFLACFLSAAIGLDPDHPRFLKKVTRTF